MKSYNLLHEPWIDCVKKDGSLSSFGLIEFNKNINDIKQILPPVVGGNQFVFYELAVYRFLILLYSVAIKTSPWDDKNAKDGITQEEINAVEEYLLRFEKKFDLLDEAFPFMQCTLDDTKKMNVEYLPNYKSFATSFVHLPSENAINTNGLIGYGLDMSHLGKDVSTKEIIEEIAKTHKLTPKEAVYHLLYLNSFAKCAGVAGCSSSSSTPELYAMFCGSHVGETIKMNLISDDGTWTSPIWERDGIYSYYSIPENTNIVGHSFYPNRLCRFEWDNGNTMSMIYSPHNFKTFGDSSKNVCRGVCEQFYQGVDRDALIKIKDDGISTIKYERTENWLNMLMSAIINSEEIPENSKSAKDIFGGGVLLPKDITIALYGRSADGKSGVYQYSEKIYHTLDSRILLNSHSVGYLERYIRLIRAQFAITKMVIGKYYKLLNKVNPHVENKVPFINQKISIYAYKKLNFVLDILLNEKDVEEKMNKVFLDIKLYTKDSIFSMLHENVLVAAQAYNSVIFGGKK